MAKFDTSAGRLARFSTVGAVLLAISAPLPVLSQTLEEVVVTARKREVNLQEAAIALSVVSGDDFDKSNIVRLDNFNGYAPGLTVAKNDGAGRVVTIRGVGWETAQNLASQPSVLTYIDGIYLANPIAMGLDLGELERVEVLRGPQGTEFGQGTTGGAINLVTKKPVLGEFNASAEVGYGTYDTFRARGHVNIPISDTLAMRASIQKRNHDGFAEIVGGALHGYDLDDADSVSGKAAFLWEPNDDWSILLQGFIHDSDQNAAAQKNLDDPISDERNLTNDFPGFYTLDNASASLHMTWDTPWGGTLKSLTGWQRLEKRQGVDGDRLSETTFALDRLGFGFPDNWDVLQFWDNDSDAFSQELNFTYESDRFDVVVGGYYLWHKNFNDFLEATGAAPFAASAAALANPGPATLPPFASVLNFVEARTVTRNDFAAYGQATFRINDMFAITGGVRYQDEDQRDFGEQFFGLFGPFDTTLKDNEVTWKAGLDITLSDNHFLYGLVSTGWKNGGTNPGSTTSVAVFLGDTFAPEEITAFEIGSRNDFLDGRVRLNVTAFYYDHEHLQYINEDPRAFAGGTGTIPKLEEYGVESEFSWLINDQWRIDGMLAWQDGKFKDDTFALDVIDFREAIEAGTPGAGLFIDPAAFFFPGNENCPAAAGVSVRCDLARTTNLNGNEPPKMADITARIGVSGTHAIPHGVLSSRIEWVHRGEMQARVFNNPQFDTIPDYDIVNLYFSYELNDAPITISVSATNIFDEDGINNIFNNPFGVWSTSNEYIPPAEVIGSVRYTWE